MWEGFNISPDQLPKYYGVGLETLYIRNAWSNKSLTVSHSHFESSCFQITPHGI